MRSTTFLVSILLSCCLYATPIYGTQPNTDVPMVAINPSASKPTWVMMLTPGQLGITDDIPPYSEVLKVARRCFNWVVNNNAPARTGNDARLVLVSAMYEPLTDMIYASTVPHSTLTTTLPATQAEAPLWYAATAEMRRSSGALRGDMSYHAEDRIFPMLERHGSWIWQVFPELDRYPGGSIVAVWMGQASNSAGWEYHTCPRCTRHAMTLGVATKPTTHGPIMLRGVPVTPDQMVELARATKAEYCALFSDPESDPGRRLRNRAILSTPNVCLSNASASIGTISGASGRETPRYSNTTGTATTPSGRPASPGVPSTISAFTTAATSTSAIVACTSVQGDPDDYMQAYCICEQSSTLPLLTSVQGGETSRGCDYTSLPSKVTFVPTTAVPPPVTATTSCTRTVCSYPVGNNVQTCTQASVEGCTVPTPVVTIERGTKPIHIGTLTSDALYSGVSSALESACPPVTQTANLTLCSEDDFFAAKNLDFVLGDDTLASDGELVVTVKSSGYNSTDIRDAMIKSAATVANYSATDKNCFTQRYRIPDKRNILRRWLPGSWWERDHGGPLVSEPEYQTWCNMHDFSGVQYFGPYWRDAAQPNVTDFMDVLFSFKEPPEDEFWCELAANVVTEITELIAPEFEVAGIAASDAVAILCEDGGS